MLPYVLGGAEHKTWEIHSGRILENAHEVRERIKCFLTSCKQLSEPQQHPVKKTVKTEIDTSHYSLLQITVSCCQNISLPWFQI